MTNVFDKVHILLCGYYFQGNTGDDIMMEAIVKSLSKYGEIKVTGSFNKEEIDWCDILLIGGGTHIRPWNVGGYEKAKYAKEKGKKVVYYAQTIEEGHPLFEEHLKRADFITVRDSESKKVVERYGLKAILTSDPVFIKKRRLIGFSFRRWLKEPSNIIERLASVLDDLSNDYDIVSIPYTLHETDTESDTSFHDRIIQLMKYKPNHVNYNQVIDHLDLLIGMRLHALIDAVNKGKKVIGINYCSKVGRIFSDLSLNEVVISYEKIERIPEMVREKIFKSDSLAMREKINEALIGKLCADIKGIRRPEVSVILPTYNEAQLLKESIDSVLGQTINDWELIIIDDGSTDHTNEIVDFYKDERIKYYNFGRNGTAFSFNVGNLLARGKIIVLLDPRVVNMDDRLEKILTEIEKSGADLTYSSLTIIHPTGEEEFLPAQPFNPDILLRRNFISYPTVAYRQNLAMDCTFNEDLTNGWDYQFFHMALKKGFKFHSIPDNTLIFRIQAEDDGSAYQIPVVSIIIPTLNRPHFIKEALESVLRQTYQNFEILVVNDGGKDISETIESLNHKGKIVYLWQKETKGPSAARNLALKAARGKYIAYLDDDDIFYPNHLETLVGFLEKSDFTVAYTDSFRALQTKIDNRYVTTEKEVIYSIDFDQDKFLISNYIHIDNICHRKDVLEEVGLFDEGLETHEDWDFCIRLSQKYDFYHIKEITAEFRIRSDISNAITLKIQDLLNTMKLIHKRYSHLVTNRHFFEEQKKAEEALTREVEMRYMSSALIDYERLHHYQFAKEFVKGKNVLVLGDGEGYGSFILSEEAESVTCIGANESNIRQASSKYIKENLDFVKGTISDISIKGEKIFDVIICFGSEENISEDDSLIKEIKRLIKDDGIFLLSIPSRPLNFNEFKILLNNNFRNTYIYGQKVYPSSNIFPLFKSSGTTRDYVIEKGDKAFLFVPHERKEAQYVIAVSSDGHIKDIPGNSYLVDVSEILFKLKDNQIRNLEAVIKDKDVHIGNLEAAVRDKDVHIGSLEAVVRDKDTHIDNLRIAISEKEATLNRIYDSHGWKALLVYYRVRNRILPENSKRRSFAKRMFRIVKKPKQAALKVALQSNQCVLKKELTFGPPVHKNKQCLRPVRRTVPEEALRFQPGEDELRIELNKIKSELAQALLFKEKNQ